MWHIEKIVKKGDYNYAVVREHPNATKYGYVLEHRVVMENMIGRLLTADEVVHHKDHNRKNNDPSNLELMSWAEHSSHHAVKGRTFMTFVCPVCDRVFSREKRNCKVASPKCSRKCSGKYSQAIKQTK